MGTKTQKEVRYLFLLRRTREQILGPLANSDDPTLKVFYFYSLALLI